MSYQLWQTLLLIIYYVPPKCFKSYQSLRNEIKYSLSNTDLNPGRSIRLEHRQNMIKISHKLMSKIFSKCSEKYVSQGPHALDKWETNQLWYITQFIPIYRVFS